MKRVIVYCEGPTEETFVKRLLAQAPCFYEREIFLSPSPCYGVSKYSIINHDLTRLCKHDPNATITTMLDYYGLPSSTPGMGSICGGDIYTRIKYIEDSIAADIGMRNFIPNLMLHEFEALLFSRPECFARYIPQPQVEELCQIRRDAVSPEHINNGFATAPSKRILSVYPKYSKPFDGFNVAQDIGLDVMRQECKHFNEWLERLEAL